MIILKASNVFVSHHLLLVTVLKSKGVFGYTLFYGRNSLLYDLLSLLF